MKVQKLKAGARIEVGDVLLHDSFAGKKWRKFVRVTEKYAIVRLNDTAEQRFPRVVRDFGMRPSGSTDIWSMVQFSAWRPVPVDASSEMVKEGEAG